MVGTRAGEWRLVALPLVPLLLVACAVAFGSCARRHGPTPYTHGATSGASIDEVVDAYGMESGGGRLHFGCYTAQGVSERRAAERLLFLLESEGRTGAWLRGGWQDSLSIARERDAIYGCLKSLVRCAECPAISWGDSFEKRDAMIDSQLPLLREAVQRMGELGSAPAKDRVRGHPLEPDEVFKPGCKVPVVRCWAVAKQGGRLLISCTLVDGVSKRDAARCLFESLEFNSPSDAWLADGWESIDGTIRLRDVIYGCLKHVCECEECPNLKSWVSPEERDVTIRLQLPKLCDAVMRLHREP